MINYYIKYLELLDTVFLALKKKPLGTLISVTDEVISHMTQLFSTSSTIPQPLYSVTRS